MDRELAAYSELPEVHGVFVCDNRGEVVASSSPSALATDSMASVAREVVRTLSALQAAGRSATCVQFEFDTWNLHARDLNGKGVLIVLAKPEADNALIRMITEITAVTWQDDNKVAKTLNRRPADRRLLVGRESVDDVSRRSWAAFAGA